MAREKEEKLSEIVDELSEIREALETVGDELRELHQSIMVIGILKMVEVRPEMKEKLEPMFKEMVESFAMDIEEEEEDE